MRNLIIILIFFVTCEVNAQFKNSFSIYTNTMSQSVKHIDSIDYKKDGSFQFYAAFKINSDHIVWSELESDTIYFDQILETRNEVLYFWSYCDGDGCILAIPSSNDERYVKVWYRSRNKEKDYFCYYKWDDQVFMER